MIAVVYTLNTHEYVAVAERQTKAECDQAIIDAGYNGPDFGVEYNPKIQVIDGLIPGSDAETL